MSRLPPPSAAQLLDDRQTKRYLEVMIDRLQNNAMRVTAYAQGSSNGQSGGLQDASATVRQSYAGQAEGDRLELLESAQRQVKKLKQRDREVRAHEQAHMAAGAGIVKGGASFTFQRGPDGQMYAVGGEIKIDTSKGFESFRQTRSGLSFDHQSIQLRDQHTEKHQQASQHGPASHGFVQEEPAAYGGEHRFQAEKDGGPHQRPQDRLPGKWSGGEHIPRFS